MTKSLSSSFRSGCCSGPVLVRGLPDCRLPNVDGVDSAALPRVGQVRPSLAHPLRANAVCRLPVRLLFRLQAVPETRRILPEQSQSRPDRDRATPGAVSRLIDELTEK